MSISRRFPRHASSFSDRSTITSQTEQRCCFTTSDGRRCLANTAAPGYPHCAYHAIYGPRPGPESERPPLAHPPRENRSALWRAQAEDTDITAELLGPTEDYCIAADINFSLRRLVILLGGNRISPRRAAVLAYTFQLLLQSLRETKNELQQDAVRNSPELVPPVDRADSESAPPVLTAAIPAKNSVRS
jgi:hypothetical protein